jgi:hypothetical protein
MDVLKALRDLRLLPYILVKVWFACAELEPGVSLPDWRSPFRLFWRSV